MTLEDHYIFACRGALTGSPAILNPLIRTAFHWTLRNTRSRLDDVTMHYWKCTCSGRVRRLIDNHQCCRCQETLCR